MAIGSQGIDMESEIRSLCTCTSTYRTRGLSAPRIRKAETKFNEVKLTEFGENSQVWGDVGGVGSSAVGKNSGSDHRTRVQNEERTCSHAPDRELSGKGLPFLLWSSLRALRGPAANGHNGAQACLALRPSTLTGGTHVADLARHWWLYLT